MYDDVLFPVSFYLLDQRDLGDHAVAVASAFDSDVHLLTLTLSDEGRRDQEEHRESFLDFAAELRDSGVSASTEFRGEAVDYDDVADVIADAADDYDMVLMGHTKVSEERSRGDWPTADRVINMSSVPVLVVPLAAPRFRGVY